VRIVTGGPAWILTTIIGLLTALLRGQFSTAVEQELAAKQAYASAPASAPPGLIRQLYIGLKLDLNAIQA